MSKQLTEPQFEQALMLIADGRTISYIAKLLDFHPSTIQRHLLESGEEYEVAKEKRRDLLRGIQWEVGTTPDHKDFRYFHDKLSLIHLPEYREATRAVNAPSPEEDRAGELAEALERLNNILTARGVLPALPEGSTGMAGEP